MLARIASVFFALDVIALLVVRQMVWVESSGTLTYQTLLYPREITGAIAGAAMLMIYLSLVSLLEMFGRDMFGRRIEKTFAVVTE